MESYFDEKIQGMVVHKTRNWIVSVHPMIFNDRIILTSHDEYPHSYTAGFCYDKGGAAMLAALIWNPERDFEPLSYKKVACDSRDRPVMVDRMEGR